MNVSSLKISFTYYFQTMLYYKHLKEESQTRGSRGLLYLHHPFFIFPSDFYSKVIFSTKAFEDGTIYMYKPPLPCFHFLCGIYYFLTYYSLYFLSLLPSALLE